MREVGGRKLPYEPGTMRYDDDEFRGQRRRPWMCFRVGEPTRELASDVFLQFITKVHETMIDKGILLDGEMERLKYTVVGDNYKLWVDELRDGLMKVEKMYEKGPLSHPIVITVLDQYNHREVENITNHFSSEMWFFKLDRQEVIDMIQTYDYEVLERACEQFVEVLVESEGLLESKAFPFPVEERIDRFGDGLEVRVAQGLENRGHRRYPSSFEASHVPRSRTKIQSPMHRGLHTGHLLSPPGVPPPGLEKRREDGQSSSSFCLEAPPGLAHPSTSRGFNSKIASPPGISLSRPPGIVTPLRNHHLISEDQSSRVGHLHAEAEIEGSFILSLTDVCTARAMIQDNRKSNERGVPFTENHSEMAAFINGSKLYERFHTPFTSLSSNLDLLYVVNYAVSTRAKLVHKDSKEIIYGAFLNRFPTELKQKFLDGPIESGRWSDDSATLFFELVALFFYAARFKGSFLSSLNEFVTVWRNLTRSYDETTPEGLKEVGVSTQELVNLKKLVRQVDKWIEAAKLKDSNDTKITIPPQPEYYLERSEQSNSFHQPPVHYVKPEEIFDRQRKYERIARGMEAREESSTCHRRDREYDYGQDEADYVDHRRGGYYDEPDRDYRGNGGSLGFRVGGGAADPNYFDESMSSERTVIQRSTSRTNKQKTEEEGEILNVFDDKADEKIRLDLPVVNTDERESQKYKYNENDFEPLWMKCEIKEPPEDFRTLPATPKLSDYVNPVEPYLRRIQEDGIYKSAAHYLDVQFRLLREDLISPLRDGIDLYRKNGTCTGRRIEGVPCSDVAIFNVERVEGKQVTERDGFEMRVVYPAPYDISKLIENDKEMKELGLMMLSRDGFVDDFHLTYVQTSLLNVKGCLHLVILEETRPFVLNTSYQMAQASSYFPSYKHVLENLRNINPFVPIPFERYLVYGKKTIFRPAFHRHEKCEEQLSEERKQENFYNNIRSIAASHRCMNGKPIPNGVDDEEDDDYSYRSSTRPKKGDEDLEYEQLSVPIFRPLLGPAPKGADKIVIGGKLYDISQLLNQYHPENLDESQRIAFASAFRQEFTIIQGPPGTGKTHIGVQILKTMLENRTQWRMTEPILIICFTNSGLDNLLERTYQMIEDDEELSKDSSRPRMIRYGRKCESEFLKRRNVMSWDVRENYRQNIPDHIQREQSKASSNKRKKCETLAVSSSTLYCSRNEIISFELLSRVMDPNHQMEFVAFAGDHIDTKNHLLCNDEALACWLLDRDFGRPSKAQTKKKNNKFRASINDDSEDESYAINVENSDEEDDTELNDEQILDKIFKKMNLECTGKGVLDSANEEVDEYHTKGKWEIATDQSLHLVVLMGRKEKNKSQGVPVDESIASLVKEVKDMILMSPPLGKDELADVKFVFSLARPKRWALYQTWCIALRKLIAENLPKQIEQYRVACKEANKAFNDSDAEIMKMPMIIGATTTGCSRLRPLLEKVKPRILVVEEAAEVLEAHILSGMISSIEQVVMIGDHKQLRPNPAVHELGIEYGLRISMFERLVERGLPFCQLRQQHRMNTTIADMIVRPAFYENVHDAPNVMNYPDVEGMGENLYFWSHREKEETPDGISWMNKHEADMVASLVKYLLKQNYTFADIVVLVTYSAQRSYMYREYSMIFGAREANLVSVETVDSYQGKESKIAIVSLVRSHRGPPENTGIGFLAVANRICVALTRAQHGMYIIGNGAYLRNNSELWKKIVAKLGKNNLIDYGLPLKCTAHKNITMIESPSEFETKSPEGGCLQKCNVKKECGHVCQRRCHPKFEQEHSIKCEYTCLKTCPNPRFNHECPKRCYEECGSCMFFVEMNLECGHRITTPCSRISLSRCDQRCQKKLTCGHQCTNECSAPCLDAQDCPQKVNTELPCGHLKELVCGDMNSGGQSNVECVERCEERMLLCEHQCAELCGKPCTVECPEVIKVELICGHKQDVVCSNIGPDKSTSHIVCESLIPRTLDPCGHTENIPCGSCPLTVQCMQRCEKLLEKCGHKCGDDCGKCYETGTHQCQQRCQSVLECGHGCSARCWEPCPPCKAFCKNSCEHQSCGVSDKGFGRDCHQLCALCSNSCANKCKHRSCPLKCYEECNIKPCAEPCSEKLQCGHACLGMCGELCPKICGTCERGKYLECVSSMSSQKVHRLVMVPRCFHTFPVEFVDEHVKKLKEKNEQLRCPKCPMLLNGISRYAKYGKKRVLDANLKKMRKLVQDVDTETLAQSIKSIYQKIGSNMIAKSKNIPMDVIGAMPQFQMNITQIYAQFNEVAGKAQEKWRLFFYRDTLECMSAVILLLKLAVSNGIVQRKRIPPQIDLMIHNMFGSLPLQRFIKEFKEMNKELETTWRTGLLGVVMPKLRFQIAKMSVLTQLIIMCAAQIATGKDFTDRETRNIKTAVMMLFAMNEKQHLDAPIKSIETLINQAAPELKNLKFYFSWESLNVPNF